MAPTISISLLLFSFRGVYDGHLFHAFIYCWNFTTNMHIIIGELIKIWLKLNYFLNPLCDVCGSAQYRSVWCIIIIIINGWMKREQNMISITNTIIVMLDKSKYANVGNSSKGTFGQNCRNNTFMCTRGRELINFLG